ncbi:MAG: hypothetical protein EPN22_13925 [Nitrospirae bacterium]|nr:MAG: hypothetical protein EPN22_13925 [Nitrospirota bacterium]
MNSSILAFTLKGFAVCAVLTTALVIYMRIHKIKRPKYFYAAVLLLFFSWDNIYANIALYYFGLKDGGEHIYKVVENVDGYYDEGCELGCDPVCKERLETHKYQFIECNVAPFKTIYGPPSKFYVEQPGLHRFSLVEKGSPLCKLYYKDNPKKINEPYCIASERIDKLKSRYLYHSYNFEKVVPFIMKATSVIRDMETGEEIARATIFQHHAGWVHYLYDGTGTVALYPRDFMLRSKVLYDTSSVRLRSRGAAEKC